MGGPGSGRKKGSGGGKGKAIMGPPKPRKPRASYDTRAVAARDKRIAKHDAFLKARKSGIEKSAREARIGKLKTYR